jgi:sarcosine oxidase subunit gamma
MRDLLAIPALAPGPISVREAVTIEVMPKSGSVRITEWGRESVAAPIEVRGVTLPLEPGTCQGADPVAWWLAPRMWLLASSQYSGRDLVAALDQACAGRSCSIVDVSDSLVALEVRGRSAPGLLTRGTGFDVLAPQFVHGRCTRISLAQLPVLLRPTGEDRFELLVDRGAARWLADWLSAAATSF